MESTKIQTSRTRKGKAITSAVATLATVTALTMVPTSQAQAGIVSWFPTLFVGHIQPTELLAKNAANMAKGGGRSKDAAMSDAKNKASQACSWAKGKYAGVWHLNLEWYNHTWFSADLAYVCSDKLEKTAIVNSPNIWKNGPK